MKFSIIIPTLNEQEKIADSLLKLWHLHDQVEVIVVDGGSQDNTFTIAQPLVSKILKSGAGRARQMNLGAQYAEGEVLIFLHADTFLPDNALSLIEKHLNHHKCWGRFNIHLTGEHWMLAVIATMMNWRSCLTGIATGDQVIFVTRTAFERINGYPNIALMEDIALCLRLKEISSPLCLSAKVESSARRWLKFGIFKTIFLMWSLRLGYFFGAQPELLSQLYQHGHYWRPAWLQKFF